MAGNRQEEIAAAREKAMIAVQAIFDRYTSLRSFLKRGDNR